MRGKFRNKVNTIAKIAYAIVLVCLIIIGGCYVAYGCANDADGWWRPTYSQLRAHGVDVANGSDGTYIGWYRNTAAQHPYIVLPYGIQHVEYRSFSGKNPGNKHDSTIYYPTRISGIVLPSTLTKISGDSFEGTNITSITIPASVSNEIGQGAFIDCKQLQTVVYGNPWTFRIINDFTYSKCNNLSSFSYLPNLMKVGKQGFYKCALGGRYVSPAPLTYLGYQSYLGNNFTSVNLTNSNSLQTVCASTFYGNPISECIAIPHSVTEFQGKQFIHCNLQSISLSNNMSKSYQSFVVDTKIQGISIPNKIQEISNSSYRENAQLKTLAFANLWNSQCRLIGSRAFSDCNLGGDGTYQTYLPSSLQILGQPLGDDWATNGKVFYRNNNLSTIYFAGTGAARNVYLYPDALRIDDTNSTASNLYLGAWYSTPNFNGGTKKVNNIHGAMNLYIPANGLTLYRKYLYNVTAVNTYKNGAIQNIAYKLRPNEHPPNPDNRAGYTFGGFFDNAACTVPFNGATKNQNVYAKWSINSYRVRWIRDDGTVLKSVWLPYGTNLANQYPTNTAKTGYTFTGWTGGEATVPARNLDITANYTINTYTARYYKDSGEYIETRNFNYGSTITFPTTTKTGHTFKHWEPSDVLTMPAHDVDFTAIFAINYYMATYKHWDNTVLKGQYAPYLWTLNFPSPPSVVGHNFTGWTNYRTTMPAYNITFTTMYERNSYRARFYDYDGTYKSEVQVLYDYEVPFPSFTRIGHTHSGWESLPNGTKMPPYNFDFVATYTVNSYNVKYYDWDGTLLKNYNPKYGAELIPPSTPSRTGYTFTGWSTTGTVPAYNLRIDAQYKINQHTITWLDHEGNLIKRVKQDYNTSITYPDDPVRPYYDFLGWDTEITHVPDYDVTIRPMYRVSVLPVDATVRHTDKWEENRQAYNAWAQSNGKTEHAITEFFLGEDVLFSIDHFTLADTVEVSIIGQPSMGTVILNSTNGYSGRFEGEQLYQLGADRTVALQFRAIYSGVGSIDSSKTINIVNENYYALSQLF